MEIVAVLLLIGVAAYFFFKHGRAQAAGSGRPLAESARASLTASSEQDWLLPFVLYYVASQMQYVAEGVLPDTVRALATGRMTEEAEQSILVALQQYLPFAYGRERGPEDWPKVTRTGRDFLQAENRTLNSTVALKQYVRRMGRENGDEYVLSEPELEAQVAAIVAKIKNDEEFGFSIRNMMLKDSVGELFIAKHGVTIDVYTERLLAHYDH